MILRFDVVLVSFGFDFWSPSSKKPRLPWAPARRYGSRVALLAFEMDGAGNLWNESGACKIRHKRHSRNRAAKSEQKRVAVDKN